MVSLRWASSAIVALLACTLSGDVLREVAITIDDLPAVPGSLSIAQQQQLTRKLVRSIRSFKIPAVGFVNEGKVTTDAHARLLEQWLDGGLELGNHTYGHVGLHDVSAEEYERDIVRGETILRPLTARHGRPLRWFRHPYLHTGRTLETKSRVERFLSDRGYRIAPVTLDNGEWIFARAYHTGDAKMRKRIGEAYLDYMDRKLVYYEEQSQKLFGRNVRHILLIHANELNADWFDDLARSMRKRGYRFITLDRALEDAAYATSDTWTGRGGISWLHRWALTRGKSKSFFAGEPTTPQWVLDAAGVESE
jgi:peptidoglycan/xylan/chitin deacetylase (PgdA/CDA1 family)